jgi:DNA polymerase (family 10)
MEVKVAARNAVPIDLASAKTIAEDIKKNVTFGGKHYEIIPVGSVRRNKPQMKDIDFLVVVDNRVDIDKILPSIEVHPPYTIVNKYAAGTKRQSFVLKIEKVVVKVDFFITNKANKPFALYHHTGPAMYNVRIRAYAKKHGMKLNQYGIFDIRTGEKISTGIKTEHDLANFLGVTYRLPPSR